jgi:hypothetical protein
MGIFQRQDTSVTIDVESFRGSVDIEEGKGTSPENGTPLFRESHNHPRQAAMRAGLLPALILLIGAAACALILGIGISAAKSHEEKRFQRLSEDVVLQLEKSFHEYKSASLWLQQASRSGKQTREEFRSLYSYMLATGLDFNSIAYLTNVTHDERVIFESDTRTFMEESYPEVPYDGFKIEEHDNGTVLPYYNESRPFYFPAHYVELLEKNWDWLDLDLYATPRLGAAVKHAVTTRRATLSGLTPCKGGLNAVALVNPGILDMPPRDLSTIAVRIDQLLTYISAHLAWLCGWLPTTVERPRSMR